MGIGGDVDAVPRFAAMGRLWAGLVRLGRDLHHVAGAEPFADANLAGGDRLPVEPLAGGACAGLVAAWSFAVDGKHLGHLGHAGRNLHGFGFDPNLPPASRNKNAGKVADLNGAGGEKTFHGVRPG